MAINRPSVTVTTAVLLPEDNCASIGQRADYGSHLGGACIGIDAKLATDLEWWPDADTYPTVADLPAEIQNWVIRNKRGIGRAFQKANTIA